MHVPEYGKIVSLEEKGFYNRIRELVSDSRTNGYSPKRHAAVMKALRRINTRNLSLSSAAGIGHYLEQAIVHWSNEGSAWHRTKNGAYEVKEGRYREEMKLLHRICTRFQYSDPIKLWMSEHTQGFAEHIRNDKDLMACLGMWRSASIDERRSILEEFHMAQAIYFSRDGLQITAPLLDINNLEGAHGTCDAPPVSKALNVWETRVTLDPELLKLDSPRFPLTVLFHEGVHSIGWRLALAVEKGEIKPGHALYEHALLRRAMLNNGPRFSGEFNSLYKRSPEEKLANFNGSLFEKNFFERRKRSLKPS